MYFSYYTQLLAASTAMLIGGALATPLSYPVPTPTDADITTTITTTVRTTTTSTSIVTATMTRGTPCPTGEAGVMNFDDLKTDGVSALPLEYQDFKFAGSDGWQYFSNVSYPANSTELRSIGSAPNAILSRSYGLVSFGSENRGFSFDLTSVSFFAFTAPEATTTNTTNTLLVEIEVVRADTSVDVYYVDTQNGALNATAGPQRVEMETIGDFKDLVDVAVAVWQTFDKSTREGNPAAFVLDDIAYVKRPECTSDSEDFDI